MKRRALLAAKSVPGLRGANPAGLPMQEPIKYATTVNLKTAKALGFDVPPSLLVRADGVIE